MKIAQVSIFVIVGIVLLVSGVFFINLSTNNNDVNINVPSDFRPALFFIESCLQTAYNYAASDVGNSGGYGFSVPYGVVYESLLIPQYVYVHDLGYRFIVPSYEEIEMNLLERINDEFLNCLNGYDGHISFDSDIEPSFNLYINNRSLDLRFNSSIPVSIGDKIFELDNINIRDDFCFKDYSEIADMIVWDDYFLPAFVDITLLKDLQIKYNVSIHPYRFNSSVIFYTIRSESCKPEQFVFAIGFEMENFPPYLLKNEFTILEGEAFSGYLEYFDEEGDSVVFESDFPVHNESGYYYFIPEQKHVGTNEYYVIMDDGFNLIDDIITINVINVNDPPVLDVNDFTVKRGDLFNYKLRAYDPDNDIEDLTYSLIEGPSGMVISGNYIFWITNETGVFEVKVRASDFELYDDAEFKVTVTEEGFDESLILIAPETVLCEVNTFCSFDLDVEYNGYQEVKYSSGSSVFEIDEVTGYVKFVISEVGRHYITVSAATSMGLKVEKNIEVVIR